MEAAAASTPNGGDGRWLSQMRGEIHRLMAQPVGGGTPAYQHQHQHQHQQHQHQQQSERPAAPPAPRYDGARRQAIPPSRHPVTLAI